MDVTGQTTHLPVERHRPDLSGPGRVLVRLMKTCARMLPVVAAESSLFCRDDHQVPLGAGDDTAASAERLQFTVGGGPGLNVQSDAQAIRAAETDIARRWPVSHDELTTRTPHHSIMSPPEQC